MTHPNLMPSPILTPWDDLLAGVLTTGAWQEKRGRVRQRFGELLRDEARPARAPLEVRVHEEIAGEGFTIRYISYNVEEDERAHAYLAVPAGGNGAAPAGGFPGVLTLHGTTDWGARQTLGLAPEASNPHADRYGKRKHLDFARALVRAGYVTLSPEHFCCATRRPAEGPFDTGAFYRKHPRWSAIGKSMFENQVALDVLQSLSEVNGEKLGVTGHSLGAQNSIFIAAYDERVRCVVPNCAAQTIAQNPSPLEWSRDHWYIYIPHIREQLLRGEKPATDFHEILSLIAPRGLLEIFALNDTSVESQSQRVLLHLKIAELYRLLDKAGNHAFLVHGDEHAHTTLSIASMEAWLARHLKGVG